MGWKNVKEHYRIQHIVQMSSEGLCIGSGYISECIVVSRDGQLIKRHDRSNDLLGRYQTEMEADPAKLKDLLNTPDSFVASIPVYTYEGGQIIEKHCEALGYPNVTHDGMIQYENLFSADKAQVITWAKENAASSIRYGEQTVDELTQRLADCKARVAQEKAILAKLEADYPTAPVSSEPEAVQ